MSKRKQTQVPAALLKDDRDINLVAIYANIGRAYEIAKLGGHSVTLVYYKDDDDRERNVNIKDVERIDSFFFNHCADTNGDLILEVIRPSFSEIQHSIFRKCETLDDLNARVERAKAFPKPSLDTIGESSFTLLSTAYERLNFCLTDLEIIRRVAQTIAQLGEHSEIRIEHVAEAIQYRALVKRDSTRIYERGY